MRKSTKLLSMLLVVCMLVSLMPVGVLAAEPTGPKAASACTLGDPEAAYKLNIVNDAATLMLFEVTVNGQTETLTFGANETLSIGLNEGDSYKVTKVGNTNYKVLSESASFQSGEYENVITKEFTHKVGAGFKTGEKEIYVQRDGAYYEGDVETIGGRLRRSTARKSMPVPIIDQRLQCGARRHDQRRGAARDRERQLYRERQHQLQNTASSAAESEERGEQSTSHSTWPRSPLMTRSG